MQCPYCQEFFTRSVVDVKPATRRDPLDTGIFRCPFCEKRLRLVSDNRPARWVQMITILPVLLSFDLYTGSRTRDVHGIGYVCAGILVAWGALLLFAAIYSYPSTVGAEPAAGLTGRK